MTSTHTHRIELNFQSINKGRGGTIKKASNKSAEDVPERIFHR